MFSSENTVLFNDLYKKVLFFQEKKNVPEYLLF